MARHRFALALALTLTLGAPACSLRGDDKPQEIPRDSLPRELFDENSNSGSSVPNGQQATIFAVRTQAGERKLQPVTVSIGRPTDVVRATLDRLVSYVPASNTGDQAGSFISHGTTVRNLSAEGDGLNLDLANFSVGGTSQELAIAQIVYTATEFPQYKWVRFSIDGKPIAVPLGDRSAPPGAQVRRRDFRSLDPTTNTTTANPATGTTGTRVP